MKRLIYYSSIYTILSIIVKLISFVAILWLGKIFTPNEYAYFALLYSIHQGMSTFGGAGIKESVIGFFKDLKSNIDKDYLFSNVLLSIIPSIFFTLIFSIFFYFFYLQNKNPDLILICFMLTLFSGILSSFSLFKSHMNRLRENHFGSILYRFIPQIMIFLGGTIFILKYQNSQYFFIGSALFVSIFLFLTQLIYNKNKLSLHYGSFTKKIILNSLPYYLIAFAGWLKGYGNNFIINIYLDSFQIAAYSFLFTISGILLMIADSLNTVWAPRFYNIFSETPLDNLEEKNNFFYGILAILLGLIVSLIIIIYPFLLKMIGGNLLSYSDMHLELYLILVSYIIYTPIWHYRIHFYVNSMGNSLMKVTILSSTVGLLSMILCIKYLGSIGIYYGFLSLTLINLLIISIVALYRWKLKINWFGVLVGFFISLISFYLMYIEKNLLLCIIFLTISFFITIIYINHKRKSIFIN